MIYLVADPRPTLDEDIVNTFSAQDRARVGPGIWFVRSPRLSASEVVSDLQIGPAKTAVVIHAERFGGFTNAEAVDKLAAWSKST